MERIKIDSQPIKLRIDSEPYAKFIGRKYCAVINVFEMKRRREYYLIIDAQSLSRPLFELEESEGALRELVIWINKESDEKYAKYEISIA